VCGRYLVTSQPNDLGRLFSVDDLDAEQPAPSLNVAPTEPVPAVLERHDRRELRALRWGLIPSWADDRRIANRLINARAESVADKPAFRGAFLRRRCLLPADGYYEWRRSHDGTRHPYRIARPDRGPLAFAGLWEVWRDPAAGPDAPLLRTCTIITTAAAPSLAWLHDRMPVVLPTDAWDDWLDRDLQDEGELRHLLARTAEDVLTTTPASPAVNDPRNKDIGTPA
jgi:putative SOS response-associated peptidase YedK